MHLIRVAEHLGVKTPGHVPVHRALPLTDLHTRDVVHLVEERLGHLYGPPDRRDNEKRRLRHDRDVDNVETPRCSPPAATASTTVSSRRQLWNSRDRHNKDIDHDRVWTTLLRNCNCET